MLTAIEIIVFLLFTIDLIWPRAKWCFTILSAAHHRWSDICHKLYLQFISRTKQIVSFFFSCSSQLYFLFQFVLKISWNQRSFRQRLFRCNISTNSMIQRGKTKTKNNQATVHTKWKHYFQRNRRSWLLIFLWCFHFYHFGYFYRHI